VLDPIESVLVDDHGRPTTTSSRGSSPTSWSAAAGDPLPRRQHGEG